MSGRSSIRSVQAHGFRGWSPRDREGMVAEVAVTGHVASDVRKQRELNAGAQLAFSFFPRTSAQGMALPVFRVGPPSCEYPQRHRGVSPHPEVGSSSIRLTTKNKHHSSL